MELIISSQDCWNLNEDTIDFLTRCISWELANVMTESPCWFWNYDRNLGHRCLYDGFAWNFGWIIIQLSESTCVGSWWSEWGVMEAIATIHQEGDGVELCARRHPKVVSYDHTNSTNRLFAKMPCHFCLQIWNPKAPLVTCPRNWYLAMNIVSRFGFLQG